MAAGKDKGSGRRKVTGRALRFLFASKILRGSGSGKGRSVSYNAKRAKSIAGQRKRGVNVTKKYRNTPKGSTRPVIGGSKAAGLRGGGGGGKAKSPLSRQERITAGLRVIKNNPQAASKVAKAREMKWEGRDKKQVAAVVTGRGRDKRIAAGRAKLQEFRAAQEAKNQVAYGGGLFKSRASKPDYSSTRTQRIAAGKAVLGRLTAIANRQTSGSQKEISAATNLSGIQRMQQSYGGSKRMAAKNYRAMFAPKKRKPLKKKAA